MNAGLEAWITSLVLTSTDPRILFAGPTFYYGIWKYSIEAPQHRTFLPVIMKGVQW